MQHWTDRFAKHVFLVGACFCLIIMLLLFLFLFKEALLLVEEKEFFTLISNRWKPQSFIDVQFGLLPLINGSIIVTVMAILLAVPIGVLTAFYMAELASTFERELFKPVVELLAGIPSVVIGFFGLMVLSPIIKNIFQLPSGQNALTGAVTLAIMALPTIITLSEDAIRAVPETYRQASFAMGATRRQTLFRVIGPAALPGITAAVMLGIGRVVGETMAVMMVTGNAALMTWSPFESVRTLTATIAAEMGEVAFGSTHYSALFWVGILLLLMTFLLNLAAHKLLRRYRSYE